VAMTFVLSMLSLTPSSLISDIEEQHCLVWQTKHERAKLLTHL